MMTPAGIDDVTLLLEEVNGVACAVHATRPALNEVTERIRELPGGMCKTITSAERGACTRL